MQKFGVQRIMATLTHITFFLTLLWVFFSFHQHKSSLQHAKAADSQKRKTLSFAQELIRPKTAGVAENIPDEQPAARPSDDSTREKNEFVPLAVDYSKQKPHYKDKVVVLLYHHIDPRETGITISPERFHSHLEMLKRNGYNVISMDQFLAFKKKGERCRRTRCSSPLTTVMNRFIRTHTRN